MALVTPKPPGRIRNRPLKDYAGQRWGRLTALALVERDPSTQNNHLWRFACDCGQLAAIRIKSVRSGHTASCGCLQREALTKRNTTHGLSRSHPREYRSWKDMRSRCHTPTDSDYPDYGGRGITICERWASFEAFLADMGPRPPGHTLDRIEVNEGYRPGNCRWATPTTQANNKRTNAVYEMDGRRQTLTEWCREFGIDRTKVSYRLARGMTLACALKPGDLRREGARASPSNG